MGDEKIGTAQTYLELFVYIVLFNVAFLLSTVMLHEGGHYVAGIANGCNGSIVLYDPYHSGPYTLLECPHDINLALLYMSPFLLLIPFALFFLLLKEFPERYFSVVIIGISILSAGQDIRDLTGFGVIQYTSMLFGVIIYVAGQYFLVDKTFEQFQGDI